jgi:peptidoglycan/LPS O-acetylase OafA/YrhL
LKLTRKALSQESSVFLNLVRLVACELVVIGHFITSYQPGVLTSFFFGGMLGGIGVFLFFCISGFLISYSLLQKLDNTAYRFRNFFVDRFSRIYSGLLPAMLFTTILVAGIYVTNKIYFDYLCSIESAPSILNFGMTLGMVERFPIGFFSSVFSVIRLPFPLPSVAPFGFMATLWTLVVEWWIYMFFGWIIIGSRGLSGKRQRSISYKVLFLVVAALLSLILVGLFGEFSSFIIVWFVGALMMLAFSSSTVRSKLSGYVAARVLAVLFCISLASVGYEAYVTFAFTHESFGLVFGLLISACVFLGILLLNGKSIQWISHLILRKRVVAYSSVLAGFSYTLFLIHYPIILFLNGLNASTNRILMFVPVVLLINVVAYCFANFTEKKHKELSVRIKRLLHISQC